MADSYASLANKLGLAGAGVCTLAGALGLLSTQTFWESATCVYALLAACVVFVLELGATSSAFLGKVDSSLPFSVVMFRRMITQEVFFSESVAKALLYVALVPSARRVAASEARPRPYPARRSMFARWSVLVWPGVHLLAVAALYVGDALLPPRVAPDFGVYAPVPSETTF